MRPTSAVNVQIQIQYNLKRNIKKLETLFIGYYGLQLISVANIDLLLYRYLKLQLL